MTATKKNILAAFEEFMNDNPLPSRTRDGASEKTIKGYVHDVNDFLQWWKQTEGEALTFEHLRKDPFVLNKKIVQDYVHHLERSVAIATLLRKVSSHADPRANRSAMKLGALGTLGNPLLMLPFQLLIANGYGRIYWDVEERGWPWLALSFVLYLVFTETCIYWIHHALHSELGYRWLHQYHHEWKVPTPWVSMAFHPLDSFPAGAAASPLRVPLPAARPPSTVTMLGFVSLWSVMIHDRVSLVRSGLINYTGNHTLHHWFADYNYGQFFTA